MTDPRDAVRDDIDDMQNALLRMADALAAFERALLTNTEELQRLRKANDELSDHCITLVCLLSNERRQNQELERQVEWFRSLADSREERARRDTPPDGLPPDSSKG